MFALFGVSLFVFSRMGSEFIPQLDEGDFTFQLIRSSSAGLTSSLELQKQSEAVLRREFAPITLLSEVLATASQSVVERFEQLPGQLKKSCPDLPDAARDVVMVALASARNEWVRATSALAVANAEADLADDDGDDSEVFDA